MKLTFSVGDYAWYAKCEWDAVQKTCPSCFGKKEVILILGNDERVVLPCCGCASGYDPPKGYITEYEYVVKPELIIITGMNIEINDQVEIIEYQSGHYRYKENDIFATSEEAERKAKGKKANLEKEQKTRADLIKKNVHRSFAWNAQYHIRQAKRCREEALRHDEKARLYKNRTKKASK